MAHVRYNKARKRWVADLRDEGGGQLSFKKESEARKVVREAISEVVVTGDLIDPTKTPTVEQALEAWRKNESARVDKGTLGFGEFKNMECSINLFKGFTLKGNASFASLNVGTVKMALLHVEILPQIEHGVAHKTALNRLRHLQQFFRFCELCNWTKGKPADGLKIERPPEDIAAKEEKKAKRISEDRIEKIIASATDFRSIAIRLTVRTGLRSGELRALKWENLDLDKGVVHVKAGAKARTNEIGAPKTKHGFRSVPITDAELIKDLRLWKVRQPPRQASNGLVFGNRWGKPRQPVTLTQTWLWPACDKAGVERIGWHDLRHFFASVLLFKTELSPKFIAQLMGHHSAEFTMQVYGHWLEDAKRDSAIADQLARAFS